MAMTPLIFCLKLKKLLLRITDEHYQQQQYNNCLLQKTLLMTAVIKQENELEARAEED